MANVSYAVRYETTAEKQAFEQNWANYQKALQNHTLYQEETQQAKMNLAASKINLATSQINLAAEQAFQQECQTKIDKYTANIQVANGKGKVLAEEGVMLANKMEALDNEKKELALKVQSDLDQKCKNLHLQIDKTIKIVNSKIIFVSKLVDSNEKMSVLQVLNQLKLDFESLKLKAQPNSIAMREVVPKCKELSLQCNQIIQKIGTM